MKRSDIVMMKVEKIKDNKHIAKTRRQRGYFWEDTLVKRFNAIDGWHAFRLGSPSTALPDVLAVNNKKSILYAIEAKSGTTESLQVPFDQIDRCKNWTEHFKLYKKRKVILAFKFSTKKRVGLGEYKQRKLREIFKEWDKTKESVNLVCTYNGDVYQQSDKSKMAIPLQDHKIEFNSKYQFIHE